MRISPPQPKWWQRVVMRIAATRPGSALLSRILRRLDGFVLRFSNNETSFTSLMTGLPIIRLTTFGSVSGQPRICPLIPLPDGERLVVFATNFGSRRHPAWYHNLTANPEVLVSLDGSTTRYVARPAEAAERPRYWGQAVAMFHGFADYEQRAGGRMIPIVVLTPAEDGQRAVAADRIDIPS